jgi:NADP-dependent aldehyde dehydrogenase
MTMMTESDVDALASAAVAAARVGAAATPAERGSWLRAVAAGLDRAREGLVATAHRETHLPLTRLDGELTRTIFQLNLFADTVRDGAFLDVRIDAADPDWGMGPRPELRRMKRPIGPVIVYAASNFPFAFSVAGGDTASAWAAGCPVIVKAHEAHPQLSRETADVVQQALADAGAPSGLFGIVADRDAGIALLRHPAIAGGGFTGSIQGGRALFDIAMSRPVPIPFYAEMGSVNPVVVTPGAAAADPDRIARELIASMTMGVGQFCTKPGVVFVPAGGGVENAVRSQELPPSEPMVAGRLAESFAAGTAALQQHVGVEIVRAGHGLPQPIVFATDLDHVRADHELLLRECFGPSTVLVRYAALDDVREFLRGIDGQLTGTVIGVENDDVSDLVDVLAARCGRVLWNSWPTGVSVTYAQQHGGPYPATSLDSSTSVGTAAIERWLRPVAFQNMPEALLPAAVRDSNPWSVPQQHR